MAASLELSVIIVNYNTCKLLEDCLVSIYERSRAGSFEIIVVDNNSADESVRMLREKFPEVRLIENTDNPGFGVANNQGVAISRAPYVMLLNSDTVLLEDTGRALIEYLQANPRVAAVGPQVLLMDGSRQPKTFGLLPSARVIFNQSLLLSIIFPNTPAFAGVFIENASAREMAVGWISGVCMVIRREIYDAVGGFDPAFFLYAEDIDLCRRFVVAGWKVVRLEDHAIKHLCGGSSKTDTIVIRNGILQQRNFLKLVDASTGKAGRIFARAALAAGLALRVGLRGLRSLLRPQQGRVPFQVSLRCLTDLLGFAPQLENLHARRH